MTSQTVAEATQAKVYIHTESFNWKKNVGLTAAGLLGITLLAAGILSALHILPIPSQNMYSLAEGACMGAGGVLALGTAITLAALLVKYFSNQSIMKKYLEEEKKKTQEWIEKFERLDENKFTSFQDDINNSAVYVTLVNTEGKNFAHLYLSSDASNRFERALPKKGIDDADAWDGPLFLRTNWEDTTEPFDNQTGEIDAQDGLYHVERTDSPPLEE